MASSGDLGEPQGLARRGFVTGASARRLRAAALAVAGIILLAFAPAQARYASLVIDAATGQVLHERDADQPRHPASLTKLMTLYLIFDAVADKRINLTTRWPVSERAAS